MVKLDNTISELSPQDLEELITNAIDRRMQVWLVQLLDAVGSHQEEEQAELNYEFEASLQQAVQQAESDNLTSLKDFRRQLLDG